MSKHTRSSTTKRYAIILAIGLIVGFLAGAGVITLENLTNPSAMIDAFTALLP